MLMPCVLFAIATPGSMLFCAHLTSGWDAFWINLRTFLAFVRQPIPGVRMANETVQKFQFSSFFHVFLTREKSSSSQRFADFLKNKYKTCFLAWEINMLKRYNKNNMLINKFFGKINSKNCYISSERVQAAPLRKVSVAPRGLPQPTGAPPESQCSSVRVQSAGGKVSVAPRGSKEAVQKVSVVHCSSERLPADSFSNFIRIC